ncbi:hypothetical protein J6590_051412 [Homalodisca vitripennis]|nr:hypothetical protein J6590_051412 [Homalodisca vitripennis]
MAPSSLNHASISPTKLELHDIQALMPLLLTSKLPHAFFSVHLTAKPNQDSHNKLAFRSTVSDLSGR